MYIKGDYLEAYNFITENYKGIKGNLAQIYNFRYAIANKAGLKELALQIMKEAIVEKGFIFVAPWLPEIDEWAPLLDKLREKGIKGYVVCGDKDDDCYKCTRRFTDLLCSKKISFELKIFKGLDHDYPENINEILPKAIEFISKG